MEKRKLDQNVLDLKTMKMPIKNILTSPKTDNSVMQALQRGIRTFCITNQPVSKGPKWPIVCSRLEPNYWFEVKQKIIISSTLLS